jgi:hypothetical protein
VYWDQNEQGLGNWRTASKEGSVGQGYFDPANKMWFGAADEHPRGTEIPVDQKYTNDASMTFHFKVTDIYPVSPFSPVIFFLNLFFLPPSPSIKFPKICHSYYQCAFIF